MAETQTQEQFQGDMDWLIRRINEENTKITSNPAMSDASNQALAARADLIQEYVQKQIEGQKQFGSYALDKQGNPTVVRTVPKTMTDLLTRLNNPKTKMQAAELVSPMVLSIDTNASGAKNAGHYQLKVTPGQLKMVDKIGAGVPIGPVATTTATTGQTGPTGTTGATGPTGSTGPAGGVKVTGVANKAVSNKTAKQTGWESKFREMFPGQQWMLDIDRSKYADVFKVFQDAVKNRAWETQVGTERFKTQLENSSFMTELKTNNIVGQVKAAVGDLGFDTMPFNSFLTKAMNMGWKGDNLKQEVYKEAFRQDASGNFVNPVAVTRVKASNDYLAVQKIGKDFFSTVDDHTTQQVLTGALSTEDVQRQQRELAKTKYGHLSNLIDQGFTLDSLSSSFKQQAAQLLERDPNSIDMSQSDFEQALNTGDPGNKRMMTSGEWEIKLRTDPRYNWANTQNAKAEARKLAASIAQTFGKVM